LRQSSCPQRHVFRIAQNHFDGGRKVFEAIFLRLPLAYRSRYLNQFFCFVCAINIAKSPVPVAISRIIFDLISQPYAILFYHLISIPKEMTI
jgi:hypothetical protein